MRKPPTRWSPATARATAARRQSGPPAAGRDLRDRPLLSPSLAAPQCPPDSKRPRAEFQRLWPAFPTATCSSRAFQVFEPAACIVICNIMHDALSFATARPNDWFTRRRRALTLIPGQAGGEGRRGGEQRLEVQRDKQTRPAVGAAGELAGLQTVREGQGIDNGAGRARVDPWSRRAGVNLKKVAHPIPPTRRSGGWGEEASCAHAWREGPRLWMECSLCASGRRLVAAEGRDAGVKLLQWTRSESPAMRKYSSLCRAIRG